MIPREAGSAARALAREFRVVARDNNLYFWRSHSGQEIDLVADHGQRLLPVEIKAGATIASDWLEPLLRWSDLPGAIAEPPWLVYGVEHCQSLRGIRIVPWRRIKDLGKVV